MGQSVNYPIDPPKMLKDTFANYLIPPTYPRDLRKMAAEFQVNGLRDHGYILKYFLRNNSASGISNPWTDGKVSVDWHLPADPEMGDIWMDLLDLTPHVYCVPEDPELRSMAGWYPIHPVMNWQYGGFVKAVKYEIVKTPWVAYGKKAELFGELPRWTQQETDPITEVYYQEAAIYAAWMGKALVGENILIARDIPWNSIAVSMAPLGLNLWDSIGYRREDDPTAFNLDTADYRENDDLEYLDLPPEKKVVHTEWEKNNWTGFSCFVPASGLIERTDGFVYPYVKITNLPKRDQ
jgi:hypothetical protein